MKNLLIDIECRSGCDLAKTGVYKYVESDDFKILLFGYSIDFGSAQVIDLTTESLPDSIVEAIKDDRVMKWAHSSTFERICLSRHLGFKVHDYLDPSSWRCSLVWGMYLTLPPSLEKMGEVLRLDTRKMNEGKSLIKKYCMPNQDGKFEESDSGLFDSDWQKFVEYNRIDVESEREVIEKLSSHPVPNSVWEEYVLSERINDRGILVDREFAEKCMAIDAASRKELADVMERLTSIKNPNSVQQLREWLSAKGIDTETLGKKDVQKLLVSVPAEVRPVLELRLQLAKSSVKKYQAMDMSACSDNRARGMFQFYGASRTGRFAGRIVQLQNLRSNSIPHLSETRENVRTLDYSTLRLLYDDIPDTLSQLVRTAFVAPSDTRFIVADFSAIEARVLAWLAGETWVLDAFRNNRDIYCATAERMYHCRVEKNGENAELRKKGKQATLSCGYGGGVGALKAMGALESGMKEDELRPLVDTWREANPNIVRYWSDVGSAARKALRLKTEVMLGRCTVSYDGVNLFITLPSKRKLAYIRPRAEESDCGSYVITYEGVGPNRKWERIETRGAKLVENITQAIARDILCNSMKNLSHLKIVAHIHDEVIIEADESITLDYVTKTMAEPPAWADGLPLRADGYETKFYKKD